MKSRIQRLMHRESFEQFQQSNKEEQKQDKRKYRKQQIAQNMVNKHDDDCQIRLIINRIYPNRRNSENYSVLNEIRHNILTKLNLDILARGDPIQELTSLDKIMYQEFRRLVDKQFQNSKIIPSKLIPVIGKASLIYKATVDGFNSIDFHKKCDNQGNTISFILSEYNQVFGCYTSKSWQSPENVQQVEDSEAFIFSLTKNTIHRQYQNSEYAVEHNKDWLTVLGYNDDIAIQSDCNQNMDSFCGLGGTFIPPTGYYQDDQESKVYLAGALKFRVIEIEVYQVIK
ncbi:UNKNOWN [Stylonychia lemnae]|uniref:TLDc domain-containing protein n=1 Tax=Stylonychia lemnae TaxID=5949 RepID=A0A077ZSB5_STYLE|nr:UNKNOWN [Stylonychia lemnae]|eukprot:CDW71341.1 UNKNOWN [Stylonychia lemnae]